MREVDTREWKWKKPQFIKRKKKVPTRHRKRKKKNWINAGYWNCVWQPMFLCMTCGALSSGLREHFRFQYMEALRSFSYKAGRGLLDQTSSIPSAIGCYDIRCVHWVNDCGLNTLQYIWRLKQDKEPVPHEVKQNRDEGSWAFSLGATRHVEYLLTLFRKLLHVCARATWSVHRSQNLLNWKWPQGPSSPTLKWMDQLLQYILSHARAGPAGPPSWT